MLPQTASKKQRQKSDYAEKQLREADLKTHLVQVAKMLSAEIWAQARTVAERPSRHRPSSSAIRAATPPLELHQ